MALAPNRRGERSATRSGEGSDACVFFGTTRDLAFKQIFPALAGLVRDETSTCRRWRLGVAERCRVGRIIR